MSFWGMFVVHFYDFGVMFGDHFCDFLGMFGAHFCHFLGNLFGKSILGSRRVATFFDF